MKSKLEPYRDKLEEWAKEPDVTYQKIADRLKSVGVETSETAIRRAFKNFGIEKTEEILDVEITVEDELREELDSVTRELREAKEIIRRNREKEIVDNRIVNLVDQVLGSKVKDLSRPMLSKTKNSVKSDSSYELLLMVSDAHYGEFVNPEEALGLKYDTEICKKRIEFIRDKTIQITSEGNYSKLTVACLGDMIGGVIHEELEATNQLRMVEQTADMAHILYDLGSDFMQEFPEVELIVIPGNHPRIHKKPRYKSKYDNWEHMAGAMVKGIAKHANPDLIVTVPKTLIHIHNIFNYRVGMVHGDGVKSNSFAGIPFYGLRNQREAVQALMSQTGQSRIDMFIMGHFHTHVDWPGECDIMINGSIKGGDEYGIGTRLSAPLPEQALLEWHPEHGYINKHRIKLGHVV